MPGEGAATYACGLGPSSASKPDRNRAFRRLNCTRISCESIIAVFVRRDEWRTDGAKILAGTGEGSPRLRRRLEGEKRP